jgi:hypothetical protein
MQDSQEQTTSTNDGQDLGWTPFQEPVIQRDYTKGYSSNEPITDPLAEPVFTAPNLEDFDDEDEVAEQEGASSAAPKEESKPFNPAYSELGNKEKAMGADAMCDVALDGYGKLWGWLGKFATVSDKKLDKEFAEGNINPRAELPIDEYGNTAPVREYFKEMANETQGAFEVSDQFKEDIRPPLKRVFMKKGIGMTDENMILYYVVTDSAPKLYVLQQVARSNNQILNALREQTQAFKSPPPAPTAPINDDPKSNANDEAAKDFSQREFSEAGETQTTENVDDPIIMDDDIIVESAKGFQDTPVHSKMSEFNNKELLEDMQKLADREAAQAKKTKTTRNTRKKK